MNKNKMLESLKKRLESEKEEHVRLFKKVRTHLPYIADIAAEFNVEKMVLFGSLTDSGKFTGRSDIDLGVLGVRKEDFFKLYSRLTDRIHWSIDLVDLDDDPEFRTMILAKGEIIYDRP